MNIYVVAVIVSAVFISGYFVGVFADNEPYCTDGGYSDGINLGYDLNGTLVSNTSFHNEYIVCNFNPTTITIEERDALVALSESGGKDE